MILVFLGAFTNIKLYFIALVMIMVKRRQEPIRSFLRETLRLPATSNKKAQAGRGSFKKFRATACHQKPDFQYLLDRSR